MVRRARAADSGHDTATTKTKGGLLLQSWDHTWEKASFTQQVLQTMEKHRWSVPSKPFGLPPQWLLFFQS